MDNNSTGHNVYNWTKEHLYKVLTTGKTPFVTEKLLAEAFLRIDRADFVPENQKDFAYKDQEIEIDLGEKLNSPIVIAQMLNILNIQLGYIVLDLGTGSGYVSALIANMIGSNGFVYSLERNQQILELALKNLTKYAFKNYELAFMDGANGLTSRAPFDAIHISFAYDSPPLNILEQLKIGGKLVAPMTNLEIKTFTRISETEFTQSVITAHNFTKLRLGVE